MIITDLQLLFPPATREPARQPIMLTSLAALALPRWFAWDPLLPYFTAVFLLALGVGIAMKKAPAQAQGLDKVILGGPVFIAMPMAVFATEHFLDPQGVGRIMPAWIPAHVFWVLLVGTCMTLGGFSIVFQKYAGLAAGLFGLQLLCFEALMHIPKVVAAPRNRLVWMLAFRDLSFSLGALSFAATQTHEWRTKGTHWVIPPARVVIGIVVFIFAVQDFLHPELAPGVPLRQLTPSSIPGHLFWSYLTGVVFLIAGGCLVINMKVRLAATWIGLWVFFLTIIIYIPIMVQNNFEVGRGLNPPVDILLLSGAGLCLAGSQRKEPAAQRISPVPVQRTASDCSETSSSSR